LPFVKKDFYAMSQHSDVSLHTDSPVPGIAQQWATRGTFFLCGFSMSAWAPLVPFVKMRLMIDEGQLGLLLLCIGAGSLITMPTTGFLTARWGCRQIITLAMLTLCLVLPLLAILDNTRLLALVLLIFGAAIGMLDVAMNVHAVVVEKASQRPLMSGFHALFSLGCILGPLFISTLLTLRGDPLIACLFVVIISLLILLPTSRHLHHAVQNTRPDKVWQLPRGWVLFLGILCAVMFLAEGAMFDWSAVFLSSVRHIQPDLAGLGYTLFAIAMTGGRLSGDRLIRCCGRFWVLCVGSLLVSGGFLVITLSNNLPLTVLGIVLIGLGAANLVPIIFTAAGAQPHMPANQAIAAVTTLGYAGILLGPALIGLVAHFSNLSFALGGVALLMLLVTVSARAVTR
jgi:predicted MFS family arabinose efflux permease